MNTINSFELYREVDRLAYEDRNEEGIRVLEPGIERLSEADGKHHFSFFHEILTMFY